MRIKSLEELNQEFVFDVFSRDAGDEPHEPNEGKAAEPVITNPEASQESVAPKKGKKAASAISNPEDSLASAAPVENQNAEPAISNPEKPQAPAKPKKSKKAAPAISNPIADHPEKNGRKAIKILSLTLFFLAALFALLSALAFSNYSFFTVQNGSMQGEIPKGALIMVHHIEPQDLEEGDNITYMLDWKTPVTHKIVSIHENHEGSGAIGFQIRGINSVAPDNEIVYDENIVGKVVFVLPVAGAAIAWLGEHVYIIFIILGAGFVLAIAFHITKRKAERNGHKNEKRLEDQANRNPV